MTENPIKLFATRAERYPQEDSADVTRRTLEKTADLLPVVGPATVEMFTRFLAPGLERRREEWFKELSEDLDRLAAKVEGFDLEKLVQNEAFVSATIQATTTAVATHQREKHEMLRNALLNIALSRGPHEELQQIYLNAIEAFSPLHVSVLNVLWKGNSELVRRNMWNPSTNPYAIQDYGRAITFLLPQLEGQEPLLQYILTDLRNRGFSNLSRTGDAFPQTAITNMGVTFLQFVLAPEL